MTRSVDDLAARLRQALDALHRLSEGAGDAGLYANEAALHRIYSAVDEATAELVALANRASRLACDRDICLQRAEAAEAALADMRRALNVIEATAADASVPATDALRSIQHDASRALAAAGPAPERTFPAGGSAVGQKNLSVAQPGRSPIMDRALADRAAGPAPEETTWGPDHPSYDEMGQ